MISAREALDHLREGNRRFVSGDRSRNPVVSHAHRSELAAGQEPFAVILGCSDSRVPAEMVFDQGEIPGDQCKQVGGFREWVMPTDPMTATG